MNLKKAAWLRQRLGRRPFGLDSAEAGSLKTFSTSSSLSEMEVRSYTEQMENERSWLRWQKDSGLTTTILENDSELSDRHAFHLYWFRYYRWVLKCEDEEELFIYSVAESYQEERIWLLLNSTPNVTIDDDDAAFAYSEHVKRLNFYKFLLNEAFEERTITAMNRKEDFFEMHSNMEQAILKNPELKKFYSVNDYSYRYVTSRAEVFQFEEILNGREYATQDAVDDALFEALLPNIRWDEKIDDAPLKEEDCAVDTNTANDFFSVQLLAAPAIRSTTTEHMEVGLK